MPQMALTGISRGMNKNFILLREKGAQEQLPFDIQPLLYVTYSRDKLSVFHFELARLIRRAIEGVPKRSLIPPAVLQEVLKEHYFPIETTQELERCFRTLVSECRVNAYYIGSAGLVANDRQWLDDYNRHMKDVLFCRVVFPRSLRQLCDSGESRTSLVEYCLWLAGYYSLVREGIVQFYASDEVGAWRAGMCALVFDERKVLIATGAFDNFNRKGILISSTTVGKTFKEYAKLLAVTSRKMLADDFGSLFSLSERRSTIPEIIEDATRNTEQSSLRIACRKYINRELGGE